MSSIPSGTPTTKKKSQHTSGPWQLSRDRGTIFAGLDGAGVLIRGVEQTIPHIAYVSRNGFSASLSEQEANARLITAAPDLLAVAKRLDYYREALIHREYEPGSAAVTELLDAARAAISKAEERE